MNKTYFALAALCAAASCAYAEDTAPAEPRKGAESVGVSQQSSNAATGSKALQTPSGAKPEGLVFWPARKPQGLRIPPSALEAAYASRAASAAKR